jgi:stage III sporulation protein AE
MTNIAFANDYDDSVINDYISEQLEKININDIQQYMDEESVISDIDLKSFIKDLISGQKNVLDLFDKEKIKVVLFDELRDSLKVMSMIIVLALLSSILKSLENSFSSGAISQVTNYIIFITMVTLVLIGFNDILKISSEAIDSTIGFIQIVFPIMITLLMVMGFPITSTALSPIFIGGITFINVVFKNFLFTSITIAFAVLVINHLSTSINLKKLASFIKNINFIVIAALFTIFLGLVSMQGLYVTSFDKFSVKTAKFALGNFIPIVGGFVSDSMDILLSSSQLIKSVFGSVCLVILIGISLLPIIKILSIILVYKACAIMIEPIGEDNISKFLSDVSNLMIVTLVCIIAITVMMFVTIAILTSMGVVSAG